MKKILPLALFLIFFCSCSNSSNSHLRVFPQMNTVLSELSDHYKVTTDDYSNYPNIAKKKEGWYVQVLDEKSSPFKVVREELFWSYSGKKFMPITLWPTGRTSNSQQFVSSFSSEEYSFNRCPYFGYFGWDADVIRDFSDASNPDDTIMDALARASSSLAYSFEGNQFNWQSKHEIDPKTGIRLRPDQYVDSVIYYFKMELDWCDKLRKQNSNYETIVGNAMTKYGNEVMAFYDDMVFYGKTDVVMPYFKEDLYDPLMIGAARSYLNSCDPNAILFTNGDNDTYPLEYLQIAKNIRTDVTIANMSLLNLPKYIRLAAGGQGKSLPVNFTYPLSQYDMAGSTLIYSAVGPPAPTASPKDFFSSFHLANESDSSSGMFMAYSGVKLSIDTTRFTGWGTTSLNPEVYLLSGKKYWLRSDLAQFDIICSNLNSRPIYYASTAGSLPDCVRNYKVSVGFVQRIVPGYDDRKLLFNEGVDPEKMYANLMRVGFNDTTCTDRYNGDRFMTNYRLFFAELGSYYADKDPSKCGRLLDHCDSLFPYNHWAPQPLATYAIQARYTTGQSDKGDALAGLLMDAYEKQIKEKATKPISDDDIARIKQSLQMIEDAANKNSRTSVAKRAEQIADKL